MGKSLHHSQIFSRTITALRLQPPVSILPQINYEYLQRQVALQPVSHNQCCDTLITPPKMPLYAHAGAEKSVFVTEASDKIWQFHRHMPVLLIVIVHETFLFLLPGNAVLYCWSRSRIFKLMTANSLFYIFQ